MDTSTNSNDSIDSIKPIPLSIDNFEYETFHPNDLFLVGDSLIDQRGLISHHLESANNFYKNGIRQIITQGFKIERDVINRRIATEEDREIEWVHCEVIPTDITLRPPTTLHYKTSKEIVLYPKVALAREKVYSGTLLFSCDVKLTAHLKNGSVKERVGEVKNFRISKVPIIKGSIICNTYGKSREALMQMGEDPSDPGGYFIVRGEWAVDCTENITYNQPKIYHNKGHGKSRIRCEFISKPGDTYQNSAMMLIRFYTDDTLTIEVSRDRLTGVEIPFYLVFRALGWANDKDMMDWIIYDYEAKANVKITNLLVTAMNAKYGKIKYKNIYNQIEVLKQIVDLVPEETFGYLDLKNTPDNYHNAIKTVLRVFDIYWLPHIGLTSESRHEKLKFLGLIIRKFLLTYMRDLPETDRDSYKNKRIHAAGDNYAKTFKTYFNKTVVLPIKRRMQKDINNTPFSQINLPNMVKSSIYADDFERLIVQTIVSGNKASLKIKKKTVINRLASQQLHRKNQLNVMATMRQVSSTSADSAKQSERASEMRRVHMSSLGYICTTHSPPEGEKVGINKQMAIFAFIAPSSSSEVLKRIVINDTLITRDGNLTPLEIYRGGFSRVYVNGHLLGYVSDSIVFINKYRQKRRNLEINPYTTIYWDNVQDEVQLFVDVGRMCRPLIIVYNNKRDNEAKNIKGEFHQGIAINKKDIDMLYKKTKTIDDLLREKKIEYITPEEQECCYICPNFEQLKRDQHDELHEYTHCDIPQALLGITTLTAPFGNHNSSGKVTYQTTQAKQTCGHYAMNWPFRMDKETFLQYINETPLVRTAANKYLFPNGVNCLVAMMCYTGYNQEDSLIINKAAIERGMFNGSKFSFYKTEFEQKEELGNPDASKTDGLKSANYEKIHNGVVHKGQRIEKGDILIGKYLPLPKGKNDKYLYLDRSIVYKENESAVVHNVISARNEADERFTKIALRKERPVSIGDKYCLTGDHEVLTQSGWKNIKNITHQDIIATVNGSNGELEWNQPLKVLKFKHVGKMYEFINNYVSICCTLNHKMYMRSESKGYEFIEANNAFDQELYFKRWIHNTTNEINTFYLPKMIITDKSVTKSLKENTFDMNDMLYFIGIFITSGYIDESNNIIISVNNDLYKSRLESALHKLNIHSKSLYLKKLKCIYIRYLQMALYLKQETNNPCHMPKWCMFMGAKNSLMLLNGILLEEPDHIHTISTYQYHNQHLLDNIQYLAIMAGLSVYDVKTELALGACCITNKQYSMEPITIDKTNIQSTDICDRPIERIYDGFDGFCYCITVKNNLFFTRRDNKYHITGNSSRAGQKGIAAMMLKEADMPFTKNGVRPAMIFNPHGIPSRMTMSQLFESLIGNLCSMKGTHVDGTMFKKVDIESIAEELEQMGMHRYGYERMISGLTGEFIDTLIFFGPTFYQRLQKFITDQEYSVRHALTDAITFQPLEGQGSSGGLRIGEMEKDVIVSHGSSRLLAEKFLHHSDGYNEYICRVCGKPAIVNHKENIYKCKYCKDNAEIVAIPTSWTSKLFMQEIESINVGIRRIPKPFTYEVNDTPDRELSIIDKYDNNSKKKLIEDNIILDD